MADIQTLSNDEIDVHLETATAELEAAKAFEDRHRLAHWITRLRLEQERRLRSSPDWPQPSPTSCADAQK
jgi:hypothetical protein